MKAWCVIAMTMVGGIAVPGELVRLDPAEQARAGIVLRPVLERSFGEQLRVVGQVVRAPGSTINLKAAVAGRVEALRVAPGDSVRRGEVVAELHSHEVLAMQGMLLRSAERARLADKRVEAGRELFAVDGISRIDLEVREQEAFAARLELDTAYHELVDHGVHEKVLDSVLESRQPDAHLPVIAPENGVVLELGVQLHEWVQEYESLVIIGDPRQVELELQIAPDQATAVAEGDLVEFVAVGRPNDVGRARVVSRVPQVDPTSRTLRIRARIVEPNPSMFPGAFVEGTLTHGTARRSPSVPESAVISMGGDDVVFVAQGSGAFEVRSVELGLSNDSRYEVLAGVDLDEQVAVQGVFLLKSALVKGGNGED
jgi:cobalt-zinc-cadmium efflux system membrane fusion protein